MEKEFYTPVEVAEIFRVNKATVWRWIRNKNITAISFGRYKKVSAAEVERVKQNGIDFSSNRGE